jgi:uncharacterized protein Yka (UPF0111/DUF47 family)
MFSLQQLLGKDDKFFTLLEASAEEGRASVQVLTRILTNPSVTPTLDELIASRRKEKQITAEISELLCMTFVTTFEREDIEGLSNVLYKIPKTVEKFAERFILTAPQLRDIDFSKHAGMLSEATDTVVAMVKALHTHKHLDKVSEMTRKLQKIEVDADKLMLDLLRELFSSKYDPIKVVILKDLYELLEKIVDRCRDAGNVISHIVLKYS